MKRKMMSVVGMVAILIATTSFVLFQASKPWPVPDKYNKMANPVKAESSSISAGKAIWAKECQSCHGKSGKGDGTKAKGLKTSPGDFSSAAFQSESDGAHFYRISEGREDMPSFKKKIPDEEDIWNVVNYMHTFKAK